MKLNKKWIGLLVAVVAITLLGAGPTTITEITYPRIDKITFEATSDSVGAKGGTGDIDTTTTHNYTGVITQVIILPDSNPAWRPDFGYDIFLYTPDSVDILQGAGVNADSTGKTVINVVTTNKVRFPITQEPIRLRVDSLGDTNRVTIKINLEP
jgi:hypothetical protein